MTVSWEVVVMNWPDGLLVLALALAKVVQDELAFRSPYETGWLSVTWRWRAKTQWYDKAGEWLRLNVAGWVGGLLVEVCENVHTMFSDAWHLMATCRSIAIGALVAGQGTWDALGATLLIALAYAGVFETFHDILDPKKGN